VHYKLDYQSSLSSYIIVKTVSFYSTLMHVADYLLTLAKMYWEQYLITPVNLLQCVEILYEITLNYFANTIFFRCGEL